METLRFVVPKGTPGGNKLPSLCTTRVPVRRDGGVSRFLGVKDAQQLHQRTEQLYGLPLPLKDAA